MGTYERHLVRPTVHALVEALVEATRATNVDEQGREMGRAFWEGVLPEVRTQPEGVRYWQREPESGSPGVGLAWWTDMHGRRLFRVCGSPSEIPAMKGSPRFPPFWYLCPERVVRRTRDGRTNWLALCECGACGVPEGIGWAGDRCGDCFLGRPAPVRSGVVETFREPSHPIDHLAFSPDGSLLAAGGRGLVYLWDLVARSMRGQVPRTFPEVQGLVFAHDGATLAVAGGERLLRWFDVTNGAETVALPIPHDICYLGVSQDGKALAACGRNDQEVWVQKEGGWVIESALNDALATSCLSPDGEWLVVSGDGTRKLYDLMTPFSDTLPWCDWQRPTGNDRDLAIAYREDGTICAYVNKGPHVPHHEPVFRLESIKRSDGTPDVRMWTALALKSPCFSADGRWLAGFRDNALVIRSAEESSGHHSFHANASELTALAFSPDGQTLAVAAQDGTVRLWPWRRMIVA